MKTNKFYTCKYDRPFKEIMLKKENEDLLKWFLEDILEVKIENIQIKTVEMNNGNIHIKRKYADIVLEANAGKIEIEINAWNEDYVKPRNMAYLCNIYTNHTMVGESYNEDVPIIQINFSYGLKDREKKRVYRVQDDSGKVFVENFQIYEINMDYYKKIWDNGNEKEIKKNRYYIMLDLDELELRKISKEDKVVERYMDEIVRVNSNPAFQEFMSVEEDQRKIQNSRMRAAEKAATERGMKRGMKQGMKQGIEKGIEKGIEQGIEQGILQTAKNFKGLGISIEDIMKATGLSKEEVEGL